MLFVGRIRPRELGKRNPCGLFQIITSLKRSCLELSPNRGFLERGLVRPTKAELKFRIEIGRKTEISNSKSLIS